MLSFHEHSRYRHQIRLKDFGEKAQGRLKNAKVLMVGMGGLGCPASQYLAAAGIGTLGIMDGDVVAESNLPRQVLFVQGDIGKNKASVARHRLQQQNPYIRIRAYPYFLSPEKAVKLFDAYDLIVDCTDNFPTRYLINDYCVFLNKPYVFGAVSSWEGQVALFNDTRDSGTQAVNYRDLFPEPAGQTCILDCREAGVMGVTAGFTGILQAVRCLQYFTGTGTEVPDSLYHYDSVTGQGRHWRISPHPDNPLRHLTDRAVLLKLNEAYYGSHLHTHDQEIPQISPRQFVRWRNTEPGGLQWLDVRDQMEAVQVSFPDALSIPVSELEARLGEIHRYKKTVVFCASGIKSAQAIRLLCDQYHFTNTFFNLEGGLLAYLRYASQLT